MRSRSQQATDETALSEKDQDQELEKWLDSSHVT
jgi:hypothetical protein